GGGVGHDGGRRVHHHPARRPRRDGVRLRRDAARLGRAADRRRAPAGADTVAAPDLPRPARPLRGELPRRCGRRVVRHRRPGPPGARRFDPHHRPGQGPHHPGRREHPGGRGGGGDHHPPAGPRGGRRGHARRAPRREGVRRRRPGRSRRADPRRAAGPSRRARYGQTVLARTPRGPGGAAEDGVGQDPEVRPPGGAGDGVTGGRHSVRSFCRLCQAMCGIVVDVDGDRVVRVSGDPDHPVSEGYLCPKGRALPALHHDPARLADPAWEATVDGLAVRLAGLIERHGPGVIGAYRATHWAFDGAGRAVADRFFRALPTTQLYSALTVDAPSKTLVPDLVAGAPFVFPVPDWDATRLLLLVGQNPVVSHGHSTARPNALVTLRRLRARGARLVVADPRRTETARLADVHLPVRPGSDPALLAGLVRAVFAAGAADGAYLAACAGAGSVEDLRRLVDPFTPDVVARRCSVEPALVEAAITAVVDAGRLSVQTGTGVSMGPAPNVGEWLAWALAAVTGSLDRPGGVLFNPGVLRPQDQGLVTRPRHAGPERDPASRSELRASYGEIPCTALTDEIDAGSLRALFVLGGNPLTTLPGSARLRRSFAGLDVLAVCDI